MADAFVQIGVKETRKIFVSATADSGTLTIGSAFVTLYDSTGAVAGGISNVQASGITNGAATTVQAWYTICFQTLNLAAGNYEAVFKIVYSSPDGLIHEPVVSINVVDDYLN